MKKRLSAVMALIVVAATLLAACSGTPTQVPSPLPPAAADTPAPKTIVAVSLPSLDTPLMLSYQEAFKKVFDDRYEVQVVSAGGSAATQATQVENFTALKADLMFVMAIEPAGLAPKLVAARQAGAKVLLAGGDPGDEDAYDAIMQPYHLLPPHMRP